MNFTENSWATTTTVTTTTTASSTEWPVMTPVSIQRPVDYFIICVIPFLLLTLLGNLTLLTVMFRTKKLRTKGHVFVITLSLSSVLLLVFAIPSTIYMYLCKCGLPNIWCNTVGHFNSMTLLLTMLNMSAIAVYRFLKVGFPTRTELSGVRAVLVLEFIAFFFAMVLPTLALALQWTTISYIPRFNRCTIDGARSQAIYGLFTFCLMLLSFFTSVFSYVSIFVVLRRSRSKIGSVRSRQLEVSSSPEGREVGEGTSGHNNGHLASCSNNTDITNHRLQGVKKGNRHEVKLFKICCAIFGVYLVAYVPYIALNLSGSLSTDLHQAFTIITWFGVCSSPLVYGLFHGTVRSSILSMMCFQWVAERCKAGKGEHNEGPHSTQIQPS